jgi:hypothetical protein
MGLLTCAAAVQAATPLFLAKQRVGAGRAARPALPSPAPLPASWAGSCSPQFFYFLLRAAPPTPCGSACLACRKPACVESLCERAEWSCF